MLNIQNLQNLNWRKIAMIAGFIIICLVIAFGIYYMFFKPVVVPEDTTKEVDIGQLPSADEGDQPGVIEEPVPGEAVLEDPEEDDAVIKIQAEVSTEDLPDQYAQGDVTAVTNLTYTPSSALTIDSTGNNAVIYHSESGKFYKITPSGNQILMTNKIYKNVEHIAWSPKTDKAILEFPDGTNILYNFDSDKQVTLPKNWTGFDFDSSGNQIVYKDVNPNEDYRFMGIANADGSGQKYLEYMGDEQNNFITDWSPNNKMVAQYKSGKSGTSAELFFLGQYDEKFKSITVNGYGLETTWTPDGSKLVYSAHNAFSDHKPLLHVVDAAGEKVGYNHHSLKLNTWASKCTFASKDIMYCAVPKELPYGAGLVPRIADDTADYIYKVDIKKGIKSFVAEPEIGYSLDQLQVSKDGSKLYFTDKGTKGLHLINLKKPSGIEIPEGESSSF